MRSGLHNIEAGFISGKTASLQQIATGFVRAADEGAAVATNMWPLTFTLGNKLLAPVAQDGTSRALALAIGILFRR